jgi:N-acetylglutamate synthase
VIDYRPITVADIPAALEMWTGMAGITLREADTPEMLARYLRRNPGMSILAQDGPRVVGTSLAGHDGRRGYLHHVAVHPDYRRRGIGRTLVEKCLAALLDDGILKCHLFVNTDNVEGKQFWRVLGWSERPGINLMSVTREGDTI